MVSRNLELTQAFHIKNPSQVSDRKCPDSLLFHTMTCQLWKKVMNTIMIKLCYIFISTCTYFQNTEINILFKYSHYSPYCFDNLTLINLFQNSKILIALPSWLNQFRAKLVLLYQMMAIFEGFVLCVIRDEVFLI